MGFTLESVANCKWRVFGDWQSVCVGKLWSNVTTSVAFHLGVVFEPEHEAFFKLAAERLPDRGIGVGLEAGNPS